MDAPPHCSTLDGTIFSAQSCVTVGTGPSRKSAPHEEETELPEDGMLSRTPSEVIARGVAVAQVLADGDAFHLKKRYLVRFLKQLDHNKYLLSDENTHGSACKSSYLRRWFQVPTE